MRINGQWGGFRWLMSAGLVAVLIGAAGCGHGRHSNDSSDDPSERVTRMVDRVFSRVDASDAQKESINAIATTALRAMKPIRDTLRTTRTEGVDLLSAQTIDRAAIESFRVGRVDDVTRASQIMTTAMADIAEVLTPEQRGQIREKMLERLEGRRHGHGWWR